MPGRLVQPLVRLVVRHPLAVILAFLVLSGVSVWLTATRLELRTGQNELVGADLEYNRRYLRFLEEFGDLEFIYVVIELGDDPERAMQAADAVVRRLSGLTGGESPLVEEVLHRVPAEGLRFGLPFLSPDELERLETLVEDRRGQLAELAATSTFAGFVDVAGRALDPGALASGPAQGLDGGNARLGEWGFRILSVTLDVMEDALAGEPGLPFRERLEAALDLSPRQRGYLATERGGLLLVEVAPRKNEETLQVIRGPLQEIRRVMDDIRARFPGVAMGLTGRPVLQADEMMTTARDMRISTTAALVGVLLLFIVFFRRIRRPLCAVLTLAIAILITFGVVTVTVGHLTLLSIVFAAMLVGLGIDFGIHFVARYQEELPRSGDPKQAVSDSLRTTGVSIGTGALTTAAAFFTILLVDFKGLRELGFIAGVGVIICLLSMVTLLPATILVVDRFLAARRKLAPATPLVVPFVGTLARRPRWTLGIAGVLAVAGMWWYRGLPYDPNIIELQAQELESVHYEKLLLEESDFSTWFCAFIVKGLGQVRDTLEQLEAGQRAGVLGATESVLDYLPARQGRKIPILERIHGRLEGIEFAEPTSEVDSGVLAASLDGLLDPLDDLASMAVQRGDAEAAGELTRLTGRVEDLTAAVEAAPAARLGSLGRAQESWFRDQHELLKSVRHALRPERMGPLDLPLPLRRRFVSPDGRFVVKAYPRRNIWEEDAMDEFVATCRNVDPEVTGTPIQVHESSRRMRDGFLLAALYSLVVTFLLLFLDLRDLRLTLLAMVPLVLGLLWLLELLPWLGLEFNLANFFTLPILIGCGIDGGVHIVHRFRESRSADDVLRTTSSAVALSFLTTMVGFGAMLFAMHRGVRSLGQMMVAGLACLLLASVAILPALLRLVEKDSTRSGLVEPDAR